MISNIYIKYQQKWLMLNLCCNREFSTKVAQGAIFFRFVNIQCKNGYQLPKLRTG